LSTRAFQLFAGIFLEDIGRHVHKDIIIALLPWRGKRGADPREAGSEAGARDYPTNGRTRSLPPLNLEIMKIAISGKGGVGKTTLAAALSLLMARNGNKVLAVDADPDANLASALGMPESIQKSIIPISERRTLIEERTGAKVRQYGQIFKLNPEVSDIAGTFATNFKGVSLLVLGAIESGGSGCACPENVLIKSLVTDLILYNNESLIMDMEAGIEHLGRGTARGVDVMLIVVEPGQRSIDSTNRIIRMAKEIGLRNIKLIANKIAWESDEQLIRNAFPENEIIEFIPYHDDLRKVDRIDKSVLDDINQSIVDKFENILKRLR
jgi:CO dehydrogenase maturation factor